MKIQGYPNGMNIDTMRFLMSGAKRPSEASSFITLLNDLLAEKITAEPKLFCPKLSRGLGTEPHSPYDSMFDSGFFEKDAVRIVDNRPIKYCSLCGSEIEADGSCPICIVPLKLCGNTAAQNQAIQNQHLQNHIQQQAVSAMGSGQSAASSESKQK